ncbi:YtxH domain-containing protein [uncultured Sunxiuqinia sp.]|uniref:YtxH domain-containing protein n=1 Tax=uncultured Sunxiuqinia sp. TaxID=1573825 RepID=UPI002AA71872|nr:YtxH domain-containing protein [uncultured Sunxiuqinia sp.]
MSKGTSALLGFVAGAATGALVGVLFAPERGDKTRKKIQKSVKRVSEDVTDTIGEKVDSLKDQVSEMIDQVKERTNDVEEKIKKEAKTSTAGK